MTVNTKITSATFGLKQSTPITITPKDVLAARTYIASYWSNLTKINTEDTDTLVGLPNKYIVPASEESHAFDFNEMYYWDTYFIAKAFYDPKYKELCLGMLQNLFTLQNRFKIIPNATRNYLMGRSQPPFLSSYILEAYEAFDLGQTWLQESIKIAHNEYATVWLGTKKPHDRQVYMGLSRYYDINYLHDLAEAESGWDMNPRFGRKALNYLPVDLNSLLYKYETDFAKVANILGDTKSEIEWLKKATLRKDAMNTLMWSDMKGLYFDYDYSRNKRGTVSSLAAYFPMWAGMVSEKQAAKLVRNLKKFEEKGGLATTDQQFSNRIPKGLLLNALPVQWAYPNGWAPLHLLVIEALEKYGYHEDAKRIALKWIKTNVDWFTTHGVFLEKYNVVSPTKPPIKGVYPTQIGFGWTNAVFEKLCLLYVD